jgi:hypothetical protein
MTQATMRDWFDILQDKNNAPYFTNPEKDEFIMDANWDYVNEYIGDYESPSALGRDRSAVNALRTLISTVSITTADNPDPLEGVITETLINTALIARYAWANGTDYVVGDIVTNTGSAYVCLILNTGGVFATDLAAGKWEVLTKLPTIISPLSIIPALGKEAKFLNHSDIHKAENNVYKQGQSLQPNYTIGSAGYKLYPVEKYTACDVVCLTQPLTITALPASIHHKIVAKAMTKTGLVTENQAITLMEQPTNG